MTPLKPPPPLIFPKNGGKIDAQPKQSAVQHWSVSVSNVVFAPFVPKETAKESADLNAHFAYIKRRNASLAYRGEGVWLDTVAPNLERYKYYYLAGILALFVVKKAL